MLLQLFILVITVFYLGKGYAKNITNNNLIPN